MATLFERASKQARRRSSGEDALAFASGLILGGLVGAIAAIALAPTDGATLRQRIAERVDELLGGGSPLAGPAPGAGPPSESSPVAVAQDGKEGTPGVTTVTSADGRSGPVVSPA
jgi:hypothetical protein